MFVIGSEGVQFKEVMSDFEGEEWFSKDVGWNKKHADAVKAELRGKKCVKWLVFS